jgi:hypothetical protein
MSIRMMLGGLCGAVFWIYVVLAVLALLYIPVSVYGLFGVEPDSLSGLFAVVLALPWISLVSGIAGVGLFWNIVLVAGCLVLNAAILWMLCRLFRR